MKQKVQEPEDLTQVDRCPGGLETNQSRLDYGKGQLQGDLLSYKKPKLM